MTRCSSAAGGRRGIHPIRCLQAIRMEFQLRAPPDTAEFGESGRKSNALPKRRRFLKVRRKIGNALITKRKFRPRAIFSTELMHPLPKFALKTRHGSHRLH